MMSTSHEDRVPRASSDAVRSCVVCRRERSQDALVRVGQIDGHPIVGRPGRGRSAYVCVARACLENLSAAALSRGLRHAVQLDRVQFVEELHRLAERRVLEMVGLARRQGALVFGVDDVAGGSGVVLVATDLSGRSRRDLGESARVFVDGATLGRAAGMGWLGAVRIDVKRLAEQAEYWLALWYESRAVAAEPVTGAPAGAERRSGS